MCRELQSLDGRGWLRSWQSTHAYINLHAWPWRWCGMCSRGGNPGSESLGPRLRRSKIRCGWDCRLLLGWLCSWERLQNRRARGLLSSSAFPFHAQFSSAIALFPHFRGFLIRRLKSFFTSTDSIALNRLTLHDANKRIPMAFIKF